MAFALDYLNYDPNLIQPGEFDEFHSSTLMNDSSADIMEDEFEAGDEWNDENEYDDSLDNDNSWKIRKAATKALSCILSTFPDRLEEFYESIILALIKRLGQEREEFVVQELFSSLLESFKILSRLSPTKRTAAEKKLNNLAPELVNQISKLLSSTVIERPNWTQARITCFSFLRVMLSHNHESIPAHFIESIQKGLLSGLCEKNSYLKIEALMLLKSLFEQFSAEQLSSYLDRFLPPLFSNLCDSYFKVVAETLRCIGVLVTNIRKPV